VTGFPHEIRAILRVSMWLNRKRTERQNTPAQKRTALTDATLRSDYHAMRQLIDTGADLNKFDDF
jgi:hypothetical protein